MACRAGTQLAFWINWQGGMTPCGMMTQPLFSVPESGLCPAHGSETRAATERIRLPGACAGCRLQGDLPCLRRHVRDGDRTFRHEAGICL
ncbi:MAG: hypothetical protein ACLUNO_01775 [Oscillospiraceae bacterium]